MSVPINKKSLSPILTVTFCKLSIESSNPEFPSRQRNAEDRRV